MDGWMSATTGHIAIKYMTYSCPSEVDLYFLWRSPQVFPEPLLMTKYFSPSASAEFSAL